MTTPSQSRSFPSSSFSSSSFSTASSDYSPTSTSTPFATPATRATSIAPSTFSRSGASARRAKHTLISSVSSNDSPLHHDTQASPTPVGSRSGTPSTIEPNATSADSAVNHRYKNRLQQAATITKPVTLAPTNSELSKDAQDFFARAQAMGLRLTRQDYERTRAGVTAFLKADRAPAHSRQASSKGVSSSNESSTASLTCKSVDADGSPSSISKPESNLTLPFNSLHSRFPLSQSGQGPSPLARASSGISWMRNASSPTLSFFSAVVAPAFSPGSTKNHPSLDQMGSAEEKRRRKLKKLRLREKRERERERTQLFTTPTAAQSSPDIETPPSRVGPTATDKLSDSGKRRRRVGLGLDLDDSDSNASPLPSTPPEPLRSAFSRRRSRGRTVSFDTQSSTDLGSQPLRHCTSLDDLSKRAWVSPRGMLRFLKSPIEPESVFPHIPIDADDSGVFLDNDEINTIVIGLPIDGWGLKHPRQASSCSSAAEALNSKMRRLSFLDQVMTHQTSPRRLYKEAKQREKQQAERRQAQEKAKTELAAKQTAENAAKADVEPSETSETPADSETATTKASLPEYPTVAVTTPDPPSRVRKAPDSVIRTTPINGSSSRNLRWSTSLASPRDLHSRMTTREHYDLIMHGISPGQPGFEGLESICNINSTPGSITFSTHWDAEPLSSLRRNGDGKLPTRNSLMASPFGSSLNDENRPELIGVSPSVAGLFHRRQSSTQGSSQAKLMRSISEGIAVMSPLSGRLIPGVQSRISDLVFDDDIQGNEEQLGAFANLGKPLGFNPKRGLLFASPTASPSGPASQTLSSFGSGLLQSPARGFGLLSPSPIKFGRELLGEADETLGGKLPFASPRSALLRAQSGSSLESVLSRREQRQTSIHGSPGDSASDVRLGKRARQESNRSRSKSWSKKTLMEGFQTISPADVFGSSAPRGLAALSNSKPLPEPVKSGNQVLPLGSSFSDDEYADVENQDDEPGSARKNLGTPRRARSHSPQSPFKQREATESALASLSVGSKPVPEAPELGALRADSAEPVLSSPKAKNHLAAKAALQEEFTIPTQETVNVSIATASVATAPSASIAAIVAAAAVASHTKKAGSKPKQTSKATVDFKPTTPKVQDVYLFNFAQMACGVPSIKNGDEIGWDQPDGSRFVKLVSEELQAALEAGTLNEEPPSRYYLLPPGYGQSKAKPSSVSYAGLIGQAIKSSSDIRLSLAEIYAWISTTYPFFERGDRGWQNSIRHNLSLNKSFVKIEREANMPGKGGWWGVKPGHEDRFQNGMYHAAAQKFDAGKTNPQSQTLSDVKQTPPSNTNVQLAPVGQDLFAPAACMPTSVTQTSSSNERLKKKSKLKRKKGPTTDGHHSDDSGKESDGGENDASRAAKRTKGEGNANMAAADRLPLLETQPQAASQPTMFNSDTVTPIRPQSTIYASSGAGSHYSKTMPGLTDSASSPPSSPMNLMPPPSMQITADHSARKRKLASQNEGQLGYGSGFSPFGYQGSPLSGARGNSHRSLRNSALGGAFSFSNQNQSDVSRGSPLGRQIKASLGANNSLGSSPKRLWSISSPLSSMRGSVNQNSLNLSSDTNANLAGGDISMGSSDLALKSPNSAARVAAALAHSPIRGSPLRHGSTILSGSPGRSSAGAASLQMQLAMGGNQGMFGMQSFGGGVPIGAVTTPARTSGMLRFTTGLSPIRRSLANATNMNVMQNQAMMTAGGQQAAWYLDDPFDVQANLQQEFDFHTQIGSFGNSMANPSSELMNNSPLRMAWNSIQAAGGVQAFTNNSQFQQQQQHHHHLHHLQQHHAVTVGDTAYNHMNNVSGDLQGFMNH